MRSNGTICLNDVVLNSLWIILLEVTYKVTSNRFINLKEPQGVEQPGSAPVLGTGGRVFESRRPEIA